MHVLFISTNYIPAEGGVSHVMQYLAEGLTQKYGYKVSVLVQLEDGLSREQTYNDVDIYRVNVSYRRGFRAVGETKAFQNKIRELNPDAIIVEAAPTVTTELVLPLLKELKCKKYFHSHDFELLWYPIFQKRETLHDTLANPKNVIAWRSYFRRFFKKYAPEFDALLYISPFCKDYEYFEKYTKVPRIFLQNAADDMFFAKPETEKENLVLRKYCDLKADRYLIDVSNYNVSKRQLSVMEEFYKASHGEYAMVFVGTNPNDYFKMLQEKKREFDVTYGEKEVHILTGVEREDIPEVLREGALYLTASMHEAASIALLETMAVGTPFISTNVGNARILPGGRVVDKTEEMHLVINELLENTEVLEKIRNAGIEYAEKTCRIESAVDTLHKILSGEITE